MVGSNLALKCQTRLGVTYSDKYDSLLQNGNNYDHKRLCRTGPREIFISNKYCTSRKKLSRGNAPVYSAPSSVTRRKRFQRRLQVQPRRVGGPRQPRRHDCPHHDDVDSVDKRRSGVSILKKLFCP